MEDERTIKAQHVAPGTWCPGLPGALKNFGGPGEKRRIFSEVQWFFMEVMDYDRLRALKDQSFKAFFGQGVADLVPGSKRYYKVPQNAENKAHRGVVKVG